ncbi:ROK family transcriptional regulator [Roseibium marinum]|nr:ROK family transcriptional regulator [Roseibium marinum]
MADRSSGLNQVLARSFNERLIMSLLLQNDGMTRLQLGQASGLSAQTISVIVRALERDRLISKGEAVRGRIGPPTTPIRLNPDGAFSIGLHIGISVLEAALIDFVGTPLMLKSSPIGNFDAENILAGLSSLVVDMTEECGPVRKSGLTGIGITMPRNFDDPTLSDAVHDIDLEDEMRNRTGLEVFIQNDVTATAGAESMFGAARNLGDHLFFYLGRTIQPRLILGGRIYSGSIAVPHLKMQTAEFPDFNALKQAPDQVGPQMATWIRTCSEGLTRLILDFGKFASVPDVVISGPVRDDIADEIVRLTRDEITATKPETSIAASTLGPWALTIGAAALPFHTRFMADMLY